MTLKELIDGLDVAGLDFQAEDILDALWLASRGKELSLYAAAVISSSLGDASRDPKGRAERKEKSKIPATKTVARNGPASRLASGGESSVYAGGLPSITDRTVKAAPVAIPAGHALGNRLALMRSLRPLCHRWPSRDNLEIDEEKTAEVTAELGFRQSLGIHPVFRPSPSPWYDVDVVVEDDPVIELWNEAIRDFCQVLRDTGAFRLVRSWQLRVDSAEDIDSEVTPTVKSETPTGAQAPPTAKIETPTGARLPSRVLAGAGTRRLILFATHGSSPLWLDGTYTAVLAPWLREASVALLHMLPQERWQYTYLGDTHGLCFSEEPGLPAAKLSVEPFWWQLPSDDISTLLKIPAMSLDPAAMGDWASMQMGRGRRNPIFLLDRKQHRDSVGTNLSSKRDFERAIAQLREVSPEAFLLGVYLSPSYFTIPVARLIQEAKFGRNAHPSQLGELFLSGLVFAKASTGEGLSTDQRYFGFWPQAREILMQSLREEDAQSIAAALERRVSRYIEEVSGRTVTFKGLVPRKDGTFDLPEWAQPFARVANSVLGLPDGNESAADLVRAFERKWDASIVVSAAHLAAFDIKLDPKTVEGRVLRALLSSGLAHQADNWRWHFLPDVKQQLLRVAERSLAGATILWIEDNPRGAEREGRALTDLGATVEFVDYMSASGALPDRNFDIIISGWHRRDASHEWSPALWLPTMSAAWEARIIIYVRRFDQSQHDIAINQGAFGYAASPTELYRLVLKALYARGIDSSANIEVPDRDMLSPDLRPGHKTLQPTTATVRMYRQGFGDCFLLSLKRKGNLGAYRILVNCGVILGTPNASEKMSAIVEDIRATSMGKVDALIVTQEQWAKVSGFEQAKNSFNGISVNDVMVGWWEDPNDSLAHRLQKTGIIPHGSASLRALQLAKGLGKTLLFLRPSDPPLKLANSGARLYCLGAPRDELLMRQMYPGLVLGLDFAIELAGGDVFLFTNSSSATIWRVWQQQSWRLDDKMTTGLDLLARVVYCRARLIGNDAEILQDKALPLMPNLRILAVPIDQAIVIKKRWSVPAIKGIEEFLRTRGGRVLLSDTDPTAPLPSIKVGSLFFDTEF